MKENLNWGLLSKYRTELFGVAAIMIMIFHCQVFVQLPVWFITINNHLNSGVDIFLILSGMGLYYSYSKNNDYRRFIKNRVERTLLPYLLIGLIFWIWRYIFVELSIPDFLFNASGLSLIVKKSGNLLVIGKAAFWYVSFVLGLYIIYPVIHNAFNNVSKKKKQINFAFFVLLSVILTIFIRIYASETYASAETWLTRIPAFLTGCYLGEAIKEKRKFRFFDYILIFACLPLRVLIALIRPVFDDLILSRYLGIFIAFFVCFAVTFVLELFKCGILNKILSFFGKMSLELYLTHGMLYLVVLQYIPDMRTTDAFSSGLKALFYALVLVVSVIISFIFSKVFNIVLKKFHSRTA